MYMEEKNILVEQFIEQKAKQINDIYPNLVNDDKLKKAKGMFLNRTEDYEQIVEEINKLAEKILEEHKKNIEEYFKQKETLDGIKKNYQAVNIKDIDISQLTYQQMDNYFYHYSWKIFLPSYDINGKSILLFISR